MSASAQILLMIDAASASAVPGLNADGSLSRGRARNGSIMTTRALALRSDWSESNTIASTPTACIDRTIGPQANYRAYSPRLVGWYGQTYAIEQAIELKY